MAFQEIPCELLFVDLDKEDEKVRNEVLSYLYSRDAKLELPWETVPSKQCHAFRPQPYGYKLSSSYPAPSTVARFQGEEPVYSYYPNCTPESFPRYMGQGEPNQHAFSFEHTTQSYSYTNNFQSYNSTVTHIPVANEKQLPLLSHHDMDTVVCSLPEVIEKQVDIRSHPDITANVNGSFTDDNKVESNGIVNTSTSSLNKSWASLFNKPQHTDKNTSLPVVVNGCSKNNLSPQVNEEKEEVAEEFLQMKKDLAAKYDDPNFYRMGEYLSSHVLDSRIISLQPRGLINRSNYCYINSILQALLACPPMYNLLNGLAKEVVTEKEKLPIISGMCRFIKEFHFLPAGQRVRRPDKNQKKDHNISINCDVPFEPSWIYKMLSGMRSDSFVIEGRQEDAEEFLGCLLNGLNDEMLDLIKLVSPAMPKSVNTDMDHDSEKEWQVMGPKNKGSITRRTEFGRTPISDIFGGLLRSRIHRAGDQSTDNIQPFFTLQLNIETKKEVTSVKEALEALVCKNELEGVTSSKTNEKVEAWQQVTIEELPIVLVLHLKCFDFKLDGCTKIIKALEFPIDLKIDNKLLSSKSSSSAKEKQYKLFAVVYHDGKEATKGHYITDAYHVGYATWLRYDDSSVKTVPEEQVLNPQGTRVPYLLFYRRSDSIKSK